MPTESLEEWPNPPGKPITYDFRLSLVFKPKRFFIGVQIERADSFVLSPGFKTGRGWRVYIMFLPMVGFVFEVHERIVAHVARNPRFGSQ